MSVSFHEMHRPGHPLVLPNAWDHASAAALVEAGFAAIGTTSLGVAAAAGLLDGAGAARAETVALTRLLSRLPVPVTVDIESGFSDDPTEVARLAAEIANRGAAGINLEDGRPGGGALADPGRQTEVLAAVREAAPRLFLNARVDTYWLGIAQESTLDRARRYASAGADGVFVPGLSDVESIRAVVAEVGVPLNVLYQPGGRSVAGLAELGVARISTGSLLFRAAVHATVEAALAVRDGEPVSGALPSYGAIQSLTSAEET